MRPSLVQYGARVHRLREDAGLSVLELGKAVKLSDQHVYSIERGRYGPSFEKHDAIAAALNVLPMDLFAWLGIHPRYDFVDRTRGLSPKRLADLRTELLKFSPGGEDAWRERAARWKERRGEPTEKLLGARVRELRDEIGIKVAALATMIGQSDQQVYAIENGRYPPGFGSICYIAHAFKATEMDLFVWPGLGPRYDVADLSRFTPNAAIAALRDELEEAHQASAHRRERSTADRR